MEDRHDRLHEFLIKEFGDGNRFIDKDTPANTPSCPFNRSDFVSELSHIDSTLVKLYEKRRRLEHYLRECDRKGVEPDRDPQSVMYSTGNPRGRPHEKTAKMRNAKKRHFNFRIDADRLDELQRWAYDRGFTVAELLNTYIDSLLDEWEQNRVAEDPHHLHTIL